MALNTIWLKGDGLVKEAKAGGGMTPGHLIKRNASNEFVVHATAGGDAAPRMFALEQDFVGKGIATAYVQNDQVQALVPQPGAEIYALVPAAAAAVVIGDKLESNGDGTDGCEEESLAQKRPSFKSRQAPRPRPAVFSGLRDLKAPPETTDTRKRLDYSRAYHKWITAKHEFYYRRAWTIVLSPIPTWESWPNGCAFLDMILSF